MTEETLQSMSDTPQEPPVEPKSGTNLESNKSKKLKLVLCIIIGIIIVAAAVYFVFFYKATLDINLEPPTAQVEIAGHTNTGSTQQKLMPGEYKLKISQLGYVTYEKMIKLGASEKKDLNIQLKIQPEPKKVTNFPAKFSTLAEDGNGLIYISNEGRIGYIVYHINTDDISEPSAITPEVFGDVENMIWNPSKRLSILKKKNKHTGIYDFGRYDLLNQEEQDWGEGIGGIAYNGDGEKVVYYYTPDTGEKTLIRAKKDNSNIERLIDLREYNLIDPIVKWSKNDKNVLLITNQIYVFDMYYKTIKKLENIDSVTNADFTPDSNQIIFEQKGQLKLCDLNGENQKELSINTQLTKTTWIDNNTLFYAQRMENQATDSFFQIDINNIDKKEFDYNKSHIINAFNPIISLDLTRVFFENNGYMYLLDLVNKNYN